MDPNKITELFEQWIQTYIDGNGETKELYQQRMYGFIIGLELSGQNIEANQCKEMYASLINN